MDHIAYQGDYPLNQCNACFLFILLLMVFSLILMVLLFLPLDTNTLHQLQFYYILICFIFLADFLINLKAASQKSKYFIRQRGWLDLIGTIAMFGVAFTYSGLLRLTRLSQAERIVRKWSGQSKEGLIRDVLQQRHQYVRYVTILLACIVLTAASRLVLQFESRALGASITTGWGSFWFSIVTITMVGYGDFSPVAIWGRIPAVFVMFSGIGIIAVLLGLLSRLRIGSSFYLKPQEALDSDFESNVNQDLALFKDEEAAISQLSEKLSIVGAILIQDRRIHCRQDETLRWKWMLLQPKIKLIN